MLLNKTTMLAFLHFSTCYSTLLQRQTGKIGKLKMKNNNTWILDTIQFNHRVKGPSTSPPTDGLEKPGPLSQAGRGGQFYLPCSRLIREIDTGRWEHVGPELRILCNHGFEGPTTTNGWRDCTWFDIGPPGDTDLRPDLNSTLKWRLVDFTTSQDGNSLRRVTFEIVNSLPPLRYSIFHR